MCYINSVQISSLEEYFVYKQRKKDLRKLPASLLMQPARRGFDYALWPVIKPSADGKDWEWAAMEWGFIPSYLRNRNEVDRFRNGYKDDKGKFHIGYTTLNVVGEEMLQKPMFREAALKKRCLVLSSGFYEHRHVAQMGKRGQLLKTPVKYPYHITLTGRHSFLMAGIYNTWTDQDTGEIIDTFAIVTTMANQLMKQVHNSKQRMPTILEGKLAEEWTEPALSAADIVRLATTQYPAEKMEAQTVAKDFLNAVDPAEPFTYEGLSELNR